MNKTMFALTIILAIAMLSSVRLKEWLLDRENWQFNLILTVFFGVFIALILRSFHII